MIERTEHARQILDLLACFPVVAIIGARQTGKTTLATGIGKGFAGTVHRRPCGMLLTIFGSIAGNDVSLTPLIALCLKHVIIPVWPEK
jgi:hypothetical protein